MDIAFKLREISDRMDAAKALADFCEDLLGDTGAYCDDGSIGGLEAACLDSRTDVNSVDHASYTARQARTDIE